MNSNLIVYVHSYLTIYLAKYYIENSNQRFDNVTILYDRVEKKSLDLLQGEKVDLSQYFGSRFVTLKKFWIKKLQINQFIKQRNINGFELLVPHLYFDVLQIFASDFNCKKIIYIEEGDMSYFSEEELSVRYDNNKLLLRRILSFGFLLKRFPFPEIKKLKEYWCFHSDAFIFSNDTKQILDFGKVFFNKFPNEKFNNSTIFLLDNLSTSSEYTFDEYYFEIRKAFEFIKSQLGDKVFLKSHPSLSFFKVDSNEIISIIKQIGLDYEFIDESIEKIVANNKNVIIVTFISSLIRYCSYANVKPFFWGKSLIKQGSTWRKFLDQFSENVIFIDD